MKTLPTGQTKKAQTNFQKHPRCRHGLSVPQCREITGLVPDQEAERGQLVSRLWPELLLGSSVAPGVRNTAGNSREKRSV